MCSWVWRERQGPQATECRWPLQVTEGNWVASSQSLWKDCCSLDTLILAQWNTFQTLQPPNYNIRDSFCLKPWSAWSCVAAARGRNAHGDSLPTQQPHRESAGEQICGWKVGSSQIKIWRNVSELKGTWVFREKKGQLSPLWQNCRKLGSLRIKKNSNKFPERGKKIRLVERNCYHSHHWAHYSLVLSIFFNLC